MADNQEPGYTVDGTLDLARRAPAQPSTASIGSVLDSTRLGQESEAVQDAMRAPVESALAWDNSSFVDKAANVADQWDTTHIIQGVMADIRRLDDLEPGYKAEEHIGQIMQEYGLEATEGNIKALSATVSTRDLMQTADTLRGHQEAQQTLADHGTFAFVGGAVDPVWLAMEVASLGTGSALQVGRLGRAGLAAGGAVGITGAANTMGRDTSAGEYLLNAAMAGGVAALFGPAAAATGKTPVGQLPPLGPTPGAAGKVGSVAATDLQGVGLASATPVPGFKFNRTGLGKASDLANKFTTEFDNLTPNPEAVPFSARIMDDPLGRTAGVQENSAASLHRVWKNRAEGYLKNYHDHLADVLKERGGFGFFGRTLDFDGKANAFRESFQNEVYRDIIRRDTEYRRMGSVTRHPDEAIAKAVDHVEEINNFAGQTAKDAGLAGFEEFVPRPGYIHRSWNADAAVGALKTHGGAAVKQLFTKAVKQSIRGADDEMADAIAGAFITRLRAMHANETVDFRGSLGKTDTGSIREMLEDAKLPQSRIDGIMQRLEQNVDEKSRIKYAKGRVDLDMQASITLPNGESLSMLDLVYKDVDRVSENYAQQMVGRSALAAAGVGTSDSEIRQFATNWANAIAGPKATKAELKQAQDKIAGVMGDFTGMRPEAHQLGPAAQTVSNLTGMSVLSASGLWQLGEYGTTAFQFGLRETVTGFLAHAPGVRKVMRRIRGDSRLVQEFNDVANFQLTRDVQFKPWLRQVELNETAKDTVWQRAMHYGKQSIPFVNGMKYVQQHQAQMVAELAVQTLTKAARGDAKAIRRLRGHNISQDTLDRIASNVKAFGQVRGNRVTKLGMGAWPATDAERLTMAAARLMDSGLLMARTGEGATWLRSPVGQVLGMFRSFVAYSHNKQLRAITANHGVLGLAHIMAYQYPLMYMLQFVNDARKHPKGDGEDAAALALKSVGMLGAIGFLGDAAGLLGLTGGQPGLNTPFFSSVNNAGKVFGGVQTMASGDVTQGAWQTGKALVMATPVLAAFPATATLVESVKPDK